MLEGVPGSTHAGERLTGSNVGLCAVVIVMLVMVEGEEEVAR